MSEKKRKSASKEDGRPSKKQQTTSSVRVKHVPGPDVAKPIIAFSPGVTFPDVTFQSFSKQSGPKTNVLLQSSDHASMTYTAREDDSSIENHLKHYVAVFDPESGKLRVTEARRLTVRSTLRVAAPARDQTSEENDNVPTMSSTRAALTEAFGTKKSKKAVQSTKENRQLTRGTDADNEPISSAMLADLKEEDGDVKGEISLVDALKNKPLPPADLNTNEIDQVYSTATLIRPSPAERTLDMMPINTWVESLTTKGDVQARSRFVASRIGYHSAAILDTPDDLSVKVKQTLQILQYTQILLDLHTYVNGLPNRRQIPHFDEWPSTVWSEHTPLSLVRPIVSHFFPGRSNRPQAVTLLRTTILALTLHVKPPSWNVKTGTLVTDMSDVSLDLAIDRNDTRKLYRELGCKVAPATDTELSTWGLQRLAKKRKDEAGVLLPKPTFAQLKFPLDFPKISRGRAVGRR